jgi:Na+-translocating ferredoxin:NAD+ oxidoreductase subunit D
LGVVLYGVLIGTMVVVIRLWGGLPEGVQYSILFANGCVPLIDRVVRQRVYGTGKRRQTA